MIRSLAGIRPLSNRLQTFPISPDHKLITLVQYNVLRGMHTNMLILSLQHELTLDCDLGLSITCSPLPHQAAVPLTSSPRFSKGQSITRAGST